MGISPHPGGRFRGLAADFRPPGVGNSLSPTRKRRFRPSRGRSTTISGSGKPTWKRRTRTCRPTWKLFPTPTRGGGVDAGGGEKRFSERRGVDPPHFRNVVFVFSERPNSVYSPGDGRFYFSERNPRDEGLEGITPRWNRRKRAPWPGGGGRGLRKPAEKTDGGGGVFSAESPPIINGDTAAVGRFWSVYQSEPQRRTSVLSDHDVVSIRTRPGRAGGRTRVPTASTTSSRPGPGSGAGA